MFRLQIFLLILITPYLLGLSFHSLKADQEPHPDTHKPDSANALVLRFGGDCLLAGHYEEYAGDSVGLAFHNLDVLKTADVAMVNLECPITTRGKRINKPYNFRMNPKFLEAFVSAGIDVVSIANNHIYDYGKVGLFDTISYLDSVGIHHVGAGRNAREAHSPVIVHEKGRRIALLAYYGGGEAPKATSRRPGVANRTIESIRTDIARISNQNDTTFVVVSLHWGTEKAAFPDRNQVDFAHAVIDAGADLIIGHHPHVLQGIEKYKAGVIVYSLGNLVFGGNSRDTYDTALFEARLDGNEVSYRLIPVRIEQWQATELINAEGDEVVQHVQRLSHFFAESIFSK